MFNIYEKGKELLKIISDGAKTAPTLKQIIEMELAEFLRSEKRERMIQGDNYFVGIHDIKDKQRKGYFPDGSKKPNSIIVDNQYKKVVMQKVNYLLGQPITFNTDSETYGELLKKIFDENFQKQKTKLGKNALNNGIAWLHPYIDIEGSLKFKVFSGKEILPFWKDDEHTELDIAVRAYAVEVYEGTTKTKQTYVEIYSENGIDYYTYEGGRLIEDVTKEHQSYFTVVNEDGTEQGYNWHKIPLIAFRYNEEELPLIIACKSIQDAINESYSVCQDTSIESSRNTILILKNYDGEDLSKFRQHLNENGLIKVRSISGVEGGVDSLEIKFSPENHKIVIEMLKKAMIENAMSYDAKDDRVGSNANQMNIQSMYNDINLDAHNMEAEFKRAFRQLLDIVNMYLYNTQQGDFTDEKVEIIFNRDMMMNEAEIMDTLFKGGLQLSQKTLLAQTPWINDVNEECERIKEEKTENTNDYAELFKPVEVVENE